MVNSPRRASWASRSAPTPRTEFKRCANGGTGAWAGGSAIFFTLQTGPRGCNGKAGRIAAILTFPRFLGSSERRMTEKNGAKKKLSREEERELDVKIGFMEGLLKRDPGYVEALQILGDDYTKRGKFVAGLRVDEQLSQLRPDDPVVQ